MTGTSETLEQDTGEAVALGEVLDFLRLVWSLDHSLQRTSKRMEATLGVTGPQRFVLRILGRFPGMPAGQVARVLRVHPSTLTGILHRLDRKGLIRRRPDPRDARRVLLSLSAQGRRFDVRTEGTVEAAVQDALSTCSPRSIREARMVLLRVADRLALSGTTARAPVHSGADS